MLILYFFFRVCQPPFTRQSVKLFLQISPRSVNSLTHINFKNSHAQHFFRFLRFGFGFVWAFFCIFFFFCFGGGSFVLGLSLKTPSTIRCVVHLPDFGVTLQSAFLRRERKLGVSPCPALLLSHSHSHLRSHLQFCLQFFVKVDSQLCCCCYIKRTKSCK